MNADSEWVTQRQAADLLGVHESAVPKMVRRGDLKPRAGERPSLSRSQVLELASARAAAAAERERQRVARRKRGPRPPDDDHDWVLEPVAAAVLGCTAIALKGRAARGQVPYVVHDQRRWFRLDHLELLVRARVARERQRLPGRGALSASGYL